jgi:hypothetical protein
MFVVAALTLMPPFRGKGIVDDTRTFRQRLTILGCPTKRAME